MGEEERGHREREREVCGREERSDVISIDSQAEHTFCRPLRLLSLRRQEGSGRPVGPKLQLDQT